MDHKVDDPLSEQLLPYIPADDGSLLREALGFQNYVDPGRPVTDTAFTTQMETVLSQLRQRQDFDVNIFHVVSVPEDGLNAQHIITLFALFDKLLMGISNSCGLNAAAICKASPDLLVQSAAGSSDSLGIGCIFTDPRHIPTADQFSQSRFYGASTMPMTALKQAHGSGPFYRYPPGFDATRHAQVLAFNESQFDFSKHYYSRDVLYSFRVFSEVQRLFFTFLQRFADYAKMQGRSLATVYAAQLEELGKAYTENTLVDHSVLPTFAYLAMKSLSCDFSRGALAFQLLLSHFSTLPLVSHHSEISWLYALRLEGDRHVLEELTAYQKQWELIRDSSVNPDDPFTPHPAVAEFLAVSVFLCSLRDLIKRASVTQERAANLMTVRQLSKTCESIRTFSAIRAEIAKIPVAELGPLFPVPGLLAQATPPAGVSSTSAISSGNVLAATVSSGTSLAATSSSASRKQSSKKSPKVPVVTAATLPASPRSPSQMFSGLREYVQKHNGTYFALYDESTGNRKMIPRDQFKALPDDTRAALLQLKILPRKAAEADAPKKAAPPKKPDKSRKTQEQTAMLATSVGQFSHVPAAAQYAFGDPRHGFVPVYDQRQHVLAAQYATMPPSSVPPVYQYGMQSLPAPRVQAEVLAVGHQGLPGYGDTSRVPFYAGPQPQLHNSGGGYQVHGVGVSSGIPQPGGSSSNYQGGGGGYQGASSFFSAYAPQSPPVQQQARSAKMLGSNVAADSRALDPGDFR